MKLSDLVLSQLHSLLLRIEHAVRNLDASLVHSEELFAKDPDKRSFPRRHVEYFYTNNVGNIWMHPMSSQAELDQAKNAARRLGKAITHLFNFSRKYDVALPSIAWRHYTIGKDPEVDKEIDELFANYGESYGIEARKS